MHTDPKTPLMGSPAKQSAGILVVAITGLVVYAGLLTRSPDPNTVPWLLQIQSPDFADPYFFFPQHLLHLPVTLVFYRLLSLIVPAGNPFVPLQLVTALAGVGSAVFVFLLLRRWLGSSALAFIITLVWIFSYGNWTLQTDAWYYPLGTLFFLCSTWLLFRAKGRGSDEEAARPPNSITFAPTVASACVFSLAIMFSQLSLFLLPGTVVAILFDPRPSVRARVRRAFVFVFVVVALVGLAYLIVGDAFLGFRTLHEFTSWVLEAHPQIPRWGRLGWDRVLETLVGVVSTFVPINVGLGLRNLARGQVDVTKLLPQFSTIVVVLGLSVLPFALARYWRKIWKEHPDALIASLVWLVVPTLFMLWYEPQGIWGVLSIFSVCALGGFVLKQVLSKAARPNGPVILGAAACFVFLLFLANFMIAVYPRHALPGAGLTKAQYAAGQMSSGDIMIGLKWDWTLYLPVLDNRQAINLLNASAGKWSHEAIQDRIQQTIADARRSGSRVYMVNAGTYTEEDWRWLAQDGGLAFGVEDFDALPKKPAWQYADGEIVWELVATD